MFSNYRLVFSALAAWLVTNSLIISNVCGEEYCEYETFAPSCAGDEVIMIAEAVYGRMKIGKCIPDAYASLGCSTDVQKAVSQHCSGRQSCSYRISNLVTDYQGSCPPSAIRSYLDVTYTCLKVFTPSANCHSPMSVPVTNVGTEGYIASYVTQKTSCGDTDNPLLLTVDEGQRINITLIDFASCDTNSNEEIDGKCVVYATIRDGMGTVRNVVCGGGAKKIAPVFMSTSNSIEIQLVGKTIQQQRGERQFLLQYSIEGCADPDLPDTMWVKRFTHEALVGCKTGLQTTWLLKCVRGVWEGQVGICSSSAASAPVLAQPKNKEYPVNVAVSKPSPESTVFSNESQEWYRALLKDKNLIIISGTVVFVCILFFTLGLICIWSKYSKKETRPPMHVDHLTYGCKDYPYSRPLPPSYNLHTSARNSMPPTALQSATYAFSDTSSTYNTINQQRLSTRDHIYESTFAPNLATVTDEVAGEDTASEHKYFVLDPNYESNK